MTLALYKENMYICIYTYTRTILPQFWYRSHAGFVSSTVLAQELGVWTQGAGSFVLSIDLSTQAVYLSIHLSIYACVYCFDLLAYLYATGSAGLGT